jgi:hypothetical protein
MWKEVRAARNASQRLSESVNLHEEDHTAKTFELRDVDRELQRYFKSEDETTDPRARELDLERQRLSEWIEALNDLLDDQRGKRETRTKDLSLLEGIRNGVYREPKDYTDSREAGSLVNTESKRARHKELPPIKKKDRSSLDIPIGEDDDESEFVSEE